MTARPIRVHGATPEERAVSRAKRTSKRRAKYITDRIQSTTDQQQRLSYACDYLRAVAADLPAKRVQAVAAAVVRLARENEQPEAKR